MNIVPYISKLSSIKLEEHQKQAKIHLSDKYNQMRILIFITIIFISCQTKTNISFYALKDSKIQKFEKSITINEFIKKAESLKCEGYQIVAKSSELKEGDKYNFVIKTKCKFPNKMIFVHPDGIELPVYTCGGFRKYGVNLCEDESSNFKLIKEFYLNPKRRPDYPSIPKNATIKFVVDGNATVESIIPMMSEIKSMRDKIGEEKLSKEPFLLSIQTIKRDSILIKPPKPVN